MKNQVMNQSKRKRTAGRLVVLPVLTALAVFAAGCSGSGSWGVQQTYPVFPENARGNATNDEISSD